MQEWVVKSKTILGAVIVLLLGVYLMVSGNEQEGLAMIGIGLSLLGIRHKLERIKKG